MELHTLSAPSICISCQTQVPVQNIASTGKQSRVLLDASPALLAHPSVCLNVSYGAFSAQPVIITALSSPVNMQSAVA